MLGRLTFPLCYNFLFLLQHHTTTYFTVMGEIDFLPLLGLGFNIYMPIVLGIIVVLVLLNVTERLLNWFEIKVFRYDQAFEDDSIQEGREMLDKGKLKKSLFFILNVCILFLQSAKGPSKTRSHIRPSSTMSAEATSTRACSAARRRAAQQPAAARTPRRRARQGASTTTTTTSTTTTSPSPRQPRTHRPRRPRPGLAAGSAASAGARSTRPIPTQTRCPSRAAWTSTATIASQQAAVATRTTPLSVDPTSANSNSNSSASRPTPSRPSWPRWTWTRSTSLASPRPAHRRRHHLTRPAATATPAPPPPPLQARPPPMAPLRH